MAETSCDPKLLGELCKKKKKRIFVSLRLLFKEMKVLVVGPRKPAKQVTLCSASRLY